MELTLTHPVTNKELKVALKDPEWLDYVIRSCAPLSSAVLRRKEDCDVQ
jgi:hypothetical protein